MKRLGALDAALIAALAPLWIVCLVLSVRTQVVGGGLAMVAVAVEDGASFPALTGEFSSLYASDPLAQSGLRPGDLLLQVGDAGLRGVGTPGFIARVREESGSASSAALLYERDGERRHASLALVPVSTFLPWLTLSVAFAASAAFLLLRARPTRTVRAYFHGASCVAFGGAFFAGGALQTLAWLWIFIACCTLMLPLLFRFFIYFPDDREPSGRWHRIWPWGLGLLGLAAALFFTGRMHLGQLIADATIAASAGAFLFVATSKYRSGDPVARRQIKWALLGLYFFLLPVMLGSALAALDPRFGPLKFLGLWVSPLFPLSLLISVARFNLFDIDRLLTATASYNVVIVVLAAGALILMPSLAERASEPLGLDPSTGRVAVSLILVAAAVPAQRRLRSRLERVLFKERYAIDRGIAALLPQLSASADTEELIERAGAGLHLLFRPATCVVYADMGESFAPVFAEGRAVPPAFEASSPLVGTLRSLRSPLALGEGARGRAENDIDPFDRAALETLRAEVVVPLRLEGELAAFLCLGPKRSGDIYTATDLSHLTGVAETASNRLVRFDEEDVVREARAMQEALRRYVPGVVAEELSRGGELAVGERDVSVMFVDIRGYTRLSEGRRADEIFSTVNRYTETVSKIVQGYGGSVVEFNGDGMMSVFGAPQPLPEKERNAVQAAREILAAVERIPLDGSGDGARLSVGVGIATGSAFAGNIQAVDRMIWSVIGSTTNLAARLQSLTRDLDALLAIDSATHEALGPVGAGFIKREGTAIRGRSQTLDVYILPASGSTAGQLKGPMAASRTTA